MPKLPDDAPRNDAVVSVYLPRAVLQELRERAREDVEAAGLTLPRLNGDPFTAHVLRRLVNEYLVSRRRIASAPSVLGEVSDGGV